ncbi:MAG: hypothetical protein QW783_04265 [Candidatus Micrarchaeia archaeon]
MSSHKDRKEKNNAIFSLADNTKKHWSEMRIFTSTNFGNFEILLESKMESIKLKKIESIHEPSNEMYIKVNSFASLNEILSAINNTLNKPKINIANAIEIQLLLNDDTKKGLVKDFANHIVQNKDKFR